MLRKGVQMRVRLFAIVAALLLLATALPFTATAAAPNIGRISGTSYVDGNGNETLPLCGFAERPYTIGFNYSGSGDQLGGTGSGELTVFVAGSFLFFNGPIEIGGQPAFILGSATVMCPLSGYAILSGLYSIVVGGSVIPTGFVSQALEPGDNVCGSIFGTMSDGVHRNQGRLSLTLTAAGDSCIV